MSVYPIPDIQWASKFPVCTANFSKGALSSGLLTNLNNLPLEGAFDEKISKEKNKLEIKEDVFKLLFLYLYTKWFSIERPRAALEELVLDFRDVPYVYENDVDFLRIVAGISELSHETFCDRLAVAIRLHNDLYPVARGCLERMLAQDR